jgi:hypothetical protein
MELHGGALRLESELGVGTTATLIFPAARVVPCEPPAPATVYEAFRHVG